MKIVRVGFDVPLDTLFDYRFDAASEADVGARVLAPLGKRQMVGVILEVTDHSEVAPARLKPISRVLRDAPGFLPEDVKLMRFAASYYHHPLGAVVMSALPTALRRSKKRPDPARVHYALTEAGAAINVNELSARALTRRKLLTEFQTHQRLTVEAVRAVAATANTVLKQLVGEGWVELRDGAITQPAVMEIVAAQIGRAHV